MNENKATFHWKHYTRTFQDKPILADEGYLDIEFREYREDCNTMEETLNNVFLRVLRRIPGTERLGEPFPTDSHGFIHMNDSHDVEVHICF